MSAGVYAYFIMLCKDAFPHLFMEYGNEQFDAVF